MVLSAEAVAKYGQVVDTRSGEGFGTMCVVKVCLLVHVMAMIDAGRQDVKAVAKS